ncbi:MAG: Ig-like domain-containing protein, partial [Rhodoferax sp.]|nr:Ig-like domain-containing protein [Rhodoferax sp.]
MALETNISKTTPPKRAGRGQLRTNAGAATPSPDTAATPLDTKKARTKLRKKGAIKKFRHFHDPIYAVTTVDVDMARSDSPVLPSKPISAPPPAPDESTAHASLTDGILPTEISTPAVVAIATVIPDAPVIEVAPVVAVPLPPPVVEVTPPSTNQLVMGLGLWAGTGAAAVGTMALVRTRAGAEAVATLSPSPAPNIFATAPTLTISSSQSVLKAGETATITFTFSEEPSGFDSSDIHVTGGTLGTLSGNGSIRTALFTPAADQQNGSASIGVDAESYTDAAGNKGRAGNTPDIGFDTLVPTLAISSDRSALRMGETASITFTFSEDPLASFDATDISITGGTLGSLTGSGSVRTATFT